MNITPVLLCGGSGTRLWPLSRKSYPKQFTKLIGDMSLFQATAQRLSGTSFAAPMIVTNSDFRFIVTEQLAEVGIDPGAILIEPEGRNTAPAILAAALYLVEKDPDAVMLVAPSDHVMPDPGAFRAAVVRGTEAIVDGRIVTFGIAPDRPETGYGYLQLASPPDKSGAAVPLVCFVEKPDVARAAQMLADGCYLWNAGIFLFRAADIIEEFRSHALQLLVPVETAVRLASPDLGFLRLASEPWCQATDISIDYAVMEKSSRLSVVPYGAGWSDLGDWDAVWRQAVPGATGVVTSEHATAIECEDTLLRSESSTLELVGIGLKDIIAIAMPDAVLVAHMDRAQDVRRAVEALKSRNIKQSQSFPRDFRPWGWFESLVMGDRFQVKRIVVHPGGSLSLQSHHHRAEHWVVVQGTARVTVDEEIRLITENQSIYIPLGSRHRLENPGMLPMVLIEVQTGSYLGEDDIIRYQDIYARQ